MSHLNQFITNSIISNNDFNMEQDRLNDNLGSSLGSNNNNNNVSNNLPNNIFNTVPMSQTNSFGIIDNQSHNANNFDVYNNMLLDNNNNNNNNTNQNNTPNNTQGTYGLLNNTPLSSITPISALTPNSIPLIQGQNANSNLLPASVSMTPQLSMNSQMGMNDLLPLPDMNNTNFSTNNSVEISNIPSRTVYLGNIPNGISAFELLNHVRSGTVESLRMIPSKNCAFISFLDEKSATLFHSDAILKRLTIFNNDIKIGWGKPSPLQPIVASCVQRYNATRNVYIGNLTYDVTEDELRHDVAEFGDIDTIKIIREKKIAFIHFTSVLAAIKCVQSLPLVDKYKERKIFYGKDRCAFITKTQQHNAAQYLGLNPNSENFVNQVDRDLIANALVQQSNAAAMIATSTGGNTNLGNRTIYLGNLHPDSTVEEICNVVRGGILQNVKLITERHVCFITFIDPISAAQFYAMSSLHGLIIHNRKIKVGWGKHSGSLPNSINLAVGNGASRNIYIGGLDKIGEIYFSKEKLYHDFREFGDIEQINFFQERHCCFVNFTNISNAIKAIDGIRNNSDYQRCKINYGKDRCGNTPRQIQGNSNNNNNTNNNTHNNNTHNNNNNHNHSNNNNNNNNNNMSLTNNFTNNYESNQNGMPFNNNPMMNQKFNEQSNLGSNEINPNSIGFNNLNIDDSLQNSDSDSDSEGDESIDDAKVRFQPLGIITNSSPNKN